jgi:competence protein ComEC
MKIILKKIFSYFRYPIFTASTGFMLGIIFSELLDIENVSLVGILGVLVYSVVVFIVMQYKKLKIIIFFLIFFVLGLWRFTSFYDFPENHIIHRIGEVHRLEGVIKYDPDVRDSKSKIVVDVKELDSRDASGLILLDVPRFPEVASQERITFDVDIQEPKSFDDFDYRDYLRSQNIFTVGSTSRIIEKSFEDNTNIIKVLSDFKLKVSKNVKSQIPEPHASLLLGILIGTRESMPAKFEEDLSVTGTTHIIAVSGYNVNVIIAIILSFAGLIPKKMSFILAAFFLFVFLILVGINNLPALRAGIMGFALLLSMMIGRRGGLVSFLPLSAAILMFSNPLAYKSISFQLSFVSTLGLISFSSFFENILKKIPEIIRSELAPTLSATISTMPIILHNFGSFSLISPVVNILVLPVVPIIMAISTFYVGINLLFYRFSLIAGYIAFAPIDYMVRVISFFGNFNFSYQQFGEVHISIIVISIILLILLAFKINDQ